MRVYFEKNLRVAAEGGIKPVEGRDDVVLYAGVPIDQTVYKMIQEGRYDETIPEASLRLLSELGAAVETHA